MCSSGRSGDITTVPRSSSEAAATPPRRRTRRIFDQRADGFAEVKQHRVVVDDVEGLVIERQFEDGGSIKPCRRVYTKGRFRDPSPVRALP
jgi:hypothetical protein